MKKLIVLVYVIAGAGFSVYAIIQEVQPALFLLDIFAPNPGDKYPIVLVGLLTYIIILLPMFIILFITKKIRLVKESNAKAEGSGVWIIRKKQLQSALVAVPIYINDKKVGVIDSGRIKFFAVSPGESILQAGRGKSGSEKITFNCKIDEQLYYQLNLEDTGFVMKNVLQPITAENMAFNTP